MLEDAFVIAIAFWGQEFVIKALPQILLLLFFLHFSEAWCLQLRPTIFTNDPAWSAQLLSTPVVLQFPIVNEIYWPFVVFSNRDLCPMSSAASVEDVVGLCSGLVPNIIKAPWCREKQGYLLSGGNNFLFSCFKKAFFFLNFETNLILCKSVPLTSKRFPKLVPPLCFVHEVSCWERLVLWSQTSGLVASPWIHPCSWVLQAGFSQLKVSGRQSW